MTLWLNFSYNYSVNLLQILPLSKHRLWRRYVPRTDAINETLRLNRFDIADSFCYMYLIDRFSHLLRCEVALHFINT